jgi:hypothetical protein
VGDRDTDTTMPHICADFATARGVVTYNAPRPGLRTSPSTAFYRTTGHERCTSKSFVSLPRAEHECPQVGLVCGSEVNFGAETSLPAASSFGFGSSRRARCMRMDSNERAIDLRNVPVDFAWLFRYVISASIHGHFRPIPHESSSRSMGCEHTVPHRPSTCASAASAWGSQKVMSMARYRSMAVVRAARACSPRPVWP